MCERPWWELFTRGCSSPPYTTQWAPSEGVRLALFKQFFIEITTDIWTQHKHFPLNPEEKWLKCFWPKCFLYIPWYYLCEWFSVQHKDTGSEFQPGQGEVPSLLSSAHKPRHVVFFKVGRNTAPPPPSSDSHRNRGHQGSVLQTWD